jgi:hypothetical protein
MNFLIYILNFFLENILHTQIFFLIYNQHAGQIECIVCWAWPLPLILTRPVTI